MPIVNVNIQMPDVCDDGHVKCQFHSCEFNYHNIIFEYCTLFSRETKDGIPCAKCMEARKAGNA